LEGLYELLPSETIHQKRDRVAFGFSVWQGIRIRELEALRVEDVDLRAAKVHIARGRNTNHRFIKLAPVQVMDLNEYIRHVRPELLARSGRETEKLLVTSFKSLYIRNFMNPLWVLVRQMYEQPIGSEHIRTSVIRGWLQTEGLRRAQYLAGHRYISSTEHYLSTDLETLQKALGHFHPF
jgi:integrase/recombinase XerD